MSKNKNVDADKLKNICSLIEKLKFDYEMLPAQSSNDLAVIRVQRPTGSQTSFAEIKKTLPKGGPIGAPGSDVPAEEQKAKRFQTLAERRFLIAKLLHAYVWENGYTFSPPPPAEVENSKESYILSEPRYCIFPTRGAHPPYLPNWSGDGTHIVIDCKSFYQHFKSKNLVMLTDFLLYFYYQFAEQIQEAGMNILLDDPDDIQFHAANEKNSFLYKHRASKFLQNND